MSDVISVIIPIHNAERYLDRLLQEVTSQTYQNLDILLIDDGSTDQSLSACQKWAETDSRIRVLTQEPSGVSKARNRGLQHAKGTYITFLDADDEIRADFLNSLYQAFEDFRAQHHLEAGLTVCGYRIVIEDSGKEGESKLPEHETYAGRGIMEALFKDEGFFSAVWNKMFRRDVLLDAKGEWILFEQDVRIAEDTLWLTRVLKHVQYSAAVQRPLYTWIRRGESATGGQSSVEITLQPKNMSAIKAYFLMTKELKSYDAELSHYTQKIYMGLLRDFLVEAYRQKNEPVLKRLMKRARKEQAVFPRKNVQDGLFLTKYRICLDLIRQRTPVRLVEKVSGA